MVLYGPTDMGCVYGFVPRRPAGFNHSFPVAVATTTVAIATVAIATAAVAIATATFDSTFAVAIAITLAAVFSTPHRRHSHRYPRHVRSRVCRPQRCRIRSSGVHRRV